MEDKIALIENTLKYIKQGRIEELKELVKGFDDKDIRINFNRLIEMIGEGHKETIINVLEKEKERLDKEWKKEYMKKLMDDPRGEVDKLFKDIAKVEKKKNKKKIKKEK